MALKRRKILKQMIDIGYGTQTIPADSGGILTGDKVGLHTFSEIVNVKHAGAVGDGTSDDTTSIQAALLAEDFVYFPPGTYRLNDELTLRSGHTIWLDPGVTLRQYAADKNIFKATSQDNITIVGDGAVLYGEGAWSSGWTGISGHEGRGIQFIGCTRSTISGCHLKNFGSIGIAIVGGTDINISDCIIEGTNLYSTALATGSNHQHGIYLSNDTTYGAADRVVISGVNISGTAQGILREEQDVATVGGSTTISGIVIHDITGQHAFYLQTGYVTISGATLTNINLAGVKIQCGSSHDIKAVTATGITGYNIGTQLFELASVNTGSVYDLTLIGSANKVGYTGGYGLSVSNSSTGVVRNVRAILNLEDCRYNATLIQGAGHKDLDITLMAKDVGEDGVIITATTATGIKIRPTLRQVNNTTASGGSGIKVNSASAAVEIYDPDITDADTKMVYGIYNVASGSVIKVKGSATITGASDFAVRAVGAITEFPTMATLSGTTGPLTGVNLITSSQTIVLAKQSTSGSNVTLWNITLADNTTYWIEANIVSVLSTGGQRKGVTSTVLVYRAGGGAVVESYTADTATDTDGGVIATYGVNSVTSGAFAGVYAWIASGNDINLQVNSGGVATYNWKGRITVTVVS